MRNNNLPKILLIGHMRHGKDTVADLLNELYGYKSKSSSVAAAEIFLYDALKDKYGYKNFMECFEDRVHHREEWFDLIVEYNRYDKARLAKEIMKYNDIYTGMRSHEECDECIRQGVFNYVIGVYDPRKPLEPSSSFNIDLWEKADFIIPNSGTLEDLEQRLTDLSPIFNQEFLHAHTSGNGVETLGNY
jgi:dephospho-CoA kinase